MSGIVAYWEKESWGPESTSPGVLRKEWRIRPKSSFTEEELTKQFGDGWRRWKPFASHILEERYIRRGVDEGWHPFDAFESRDEALRGGIDHVSNLVAVDPKLTQILDEDRRAAEESRRREQEESRKASEAEERRGKQRRRDEVFQRLSQSKDKPVADAWNAYAKRHQDDPSYNERVQNDPEFMRLYRDALDLESLSQRRSAIKKFLKYTDQKGLGSMRTLGGDVEDAVYRNELAQFRRAKDVVVIDHGRLRVGDHSYVRQDKDLWYVIDRHTGDWSKPHAFLKDAVALARKSVSKKELGGMSKTAWKDLADEGYVSHGYAKNRAEPSWQPVKVSGSSFIGRHFPAAAHLAPPRLLCQESKDALKKCRARGGACKRLKAEVRKSCAR